QGANECGHSSRVRRGVKATRGPLPRPGNAVTTPQSGCPVPDPRRSFMKVLVVGKGGREHALVWKLAQSARVEGVFCAPGNAGTAEDGINVPIESGDFDRLLKFAKKEAIGLTVVGPEEPLAKGIVGAFQRAGLR